MQTLNPPADGYFRWNLVLIGHEASEEMSFKSVNDADDDGPMPTL